MSLAPGSDPRAQPARLAGGASPWLRLLGLAGVGFVLALAGALAVARPPWTAIGVPAGLALAGLLHWGWRALPAVGVGLLAALLALRHPVGLALSATATSILAAAAAGLLLRRSSFNERLKRGRDVAWLVAAVPAGALVPSMLLVMVLALAGAAPTLGDAALGYAALSLGTLLGAATALALDRRMARTGEPPGRWSESLVALLAVVAALAMLRLAPAVPSMVGMMALMAPHVVLTIVALRGYFGLATAGLTLTGMLAASSDAPIAFLGGLPGQTAGAYGVWLGSAMLLMLWAYGSAADGHARSERWEWALDGSRLGVADWNPRRARGFASAAWRSLTGFQGSGWSPAAWLERVHPDDRPALQGAIDALGEGRSGRQQLELRMPEPGSAASEGRWCWFEATLLVVERDRADHPTRMLATLADVQERRQAQERQLMSVSLFQHLHEGLLVTDADLRALDANPAYSQILGVPREEVLGTVPSLLRPDPADPVARQQRAAMWAALREQGSWRGELLERRRDGEACTLQTTISTVHGPAGDLRYHVLVIADISEQRAQRARLERQAHFDELTRLPNRARLSQLLDDAMGAAEHDGYLLVVCYLDLDRFKPVNDRFGHAAGDRLLAELAGRLRGALRSREGWTDIAARLGGDEFVLLLRSGTIEEARLAVERVLRVVAQPYVIDPNEDPVQVTASMGATIYPLDRSDADTLLRHADHAMYGAKQSGRNGYLFFDPEHRRRTEERVMAIGRVQEALDQQEFVLFYQPKVDMRTARVLGFEALLRWDHPTQGLIAPLQFLPLIENTGLSSRIGDWVISQALDHLTHWQHLGLAISVSVNVSARHLQEPDFALRLAELLARHPEPLAPWLEIEMLETAAHADIEATSALVERCRALGVKFALDDFGTGYSTLTYLKRLPVDVLKIDRSFIHHMLDDAPDRAIVEGVIGLARTFGCTVIAEGVESPAQARTLLELGCDIGQGTGIAAPMRADQVVDWTREYRGMFALAPAGGAAAPPAPAAGAAALPRAPG